ncbi:MAG: hypothetical protein RL417_1461, partial [Pseudomonadota bacterium]
MASLTTSPRHYERGSIMDLSIVFGVIAIGASVLSMEMFLKPGEAVAREASLQGGGQALVAARLSSEGTLVPAQPFDFDLSVARVRADMAANGNSAVNDACFHAVMMDPPADCSGEPLALVVQTDGDPSCTSVPSSCSAIARAAHGLECKRKFYGCQFDRISG